MGSGRKGTVDGCLWGEGGLLLTGGIEESGGDGWVGF